MPVIARIWFCWLMQYNIINNCHILAAANTTYWPILTSIGPVGKGDQIRSVVTMTTSTIADWQFYSIFWTVQRHVFVSGSDLGHHIVLFIYKCSRFKLCGTGRSMSDVSHCSSGG